MVTVGRVQSGTEQKMIVSVRMIVTGKNEEFFFSLFL